MKKKLTFDALPAAVEKILETLNSGTSEHTALPDLVQRIALLEKKIDYLQKSLSPDRPVMDTQSVCRVLKLRPKAVSELATSGVLPSRTEGRRTLFYEDAVVKYFMTQPAWNAPAPAKRAYRRKSQKEESATIYVEAETRMSVKPEGNRRINMAEASKMLGRAPGAVYQLTCSNRIPFHKDGSKVYFFTDELREWAQNHPPRPRKNKKQ